MKTGLSKGLKRFYGIGDLFFTMMTQVENVFANFFLTNIALFDLGTTTLISTVTTVIDAAFSWIYGGIINGMKPMRWGRYRSWLVAFTWTIPFIYMFKFIKIGEGLLPIVIIIVAGVVSSIIWNFPYVANLSLISVVGKTPADRMQLSSSRAVYARSASILFSFMGLPFANLLAQFVGEDNKFAALAFVLASFMVVGYYIHFKLTEGYEETLNDTEDYSNQQQVAKKEKKGTSSASMLSALFQNRPLLTFMVADVGRWVANFVILGTAVYYFQYVLGDVGLLATYLVVANVACMIGAFATKYANKVLSTKTLTVLSFFLMGGALLGAKLFYGHAWIAIAFLSLAQFAFGFIYTVAPAMYADTAILAHWKTGEDSRAWIMGMGNVPLKVSLVLRGFIINGIFAAVGFSATLTADQITDTIKAGIADVLMLVPGIALILGGVIILFGFNLTTKQIEEMTADIEAGKFYKTV